MLISKPDPAEGAPRSERTWEPMIQSLQLRLAAVVMLAVGLPVLLATHGVWIVALIAALAGGLAAPLALRWLATPLRSLIARLQVQTEAQNAMVLQLDAIAKNAPIGILVTRDSKFELMSHHACEVLGYQVGELYGLSPRLILTSDKAYEDLGEQVRAQFQAQGFFETELTYKRKDDSTLWVRMMGRPVIPNDPSGGTIWIWEDATDVRAARERLSWTASHDALTHLTNRREFELRLNHVLTQQEMLEVCVLFIDLDRFKIINDTAGHAAGDAVLVEIARLMEAQVRQSDTLCRFGGDEFAVLLHGCSLDRAQSIAEQIRAAVERKVVTFEGTDFQVGASMGLVKLTPELTTVAAVLAAADSACYEAKRKGKNRVETYKSTLPS